MSLCVQLACSSFARSLRFYTDVLGFTTMRYAPERRRAELERDGITVELLEEPGDELAPVEYPFGRGIVLVLWTQDAEAVLSGVEAYGARLHRPMEDVWHEEDGLLVGHKAFEVVDPDGYRLRFCEALPPAGR